MTKHVDLQSFIPRVSPKYASPRHLAPLTDLFERIAKGEEVFACVSAPPRHAKTDTLSHAVAWLLRLRPELRIAYVTYAQTLSEKKSRRMRALAEKARVRLDPNAASLQDWRTGVEEGGVWATSIMGPVVGEGFDLVIVDDPVKDRVAAESSLIRTRTLEYVTDTLIGRGEPGCSFVVLMHRWHPSDLIGSLVSAGWESVVLPAIKADGSALWPERFSVEALNAKRERVGEYSWHSLYQGSPISKGGSLFGDVQIYDALPEGSYREICGVDFAYSTSTRADYSVAVVCSVTDDRTYYVREVVRRQCSAPDFAAELLKLRAKYPRMSFASYAAGTEKGSIDFVARAGVHVHVMPPRLDKFNRSQLAIASWNAGKILIPKQAIWRDAFVDEIVSFTGVKDRHDDQVDALVSAHDVKQGSVNASRWRAALQGMSGNPSASPFERACAESARNKQLKAMGIDLRSLSDWPTISKIRIP